MTRTLAATTCFALLGLLSTAEAHFKLNLPAALSQQSALGDPQKSAPCGQADPGSPLVPTNMVTTLQSGTTLTISINETILHPGHYRVAIAQDQASLPADPVVTAGTTACGSTQINASPTLPLLGDGLLVHTSSFGNVVKTLEVQIPAGMTCTNCVLQVTQFMSNHGLNNPGGCFYHHCATVTIGSAPAPDAGINDPDPSETGCCGTGRGSATTGALAAFAIGLLVLRRRR